jgi:hypothetical protein
MSKRVYGLKRATPKMKYHHMNYVLDWREALRDSQEAAMTEGTRHWMIEQINSYDPGAFQDWYNKVYDLRRKGKQAEYEEAIRARYELLARRAELQAVMDDPSTSPLAKSEALDKHIKATWNDIPEIPL